MKKSELILTAVALAMGVASAVYRSAEGRSLEEESHEAL